MDPSLGAMNELLKSVNSESLSEDTRLLRDQLLIYVPPLATPEEAKDKLNATLKTARCIRGIEVHNSTGQLVDSADLTGTDKDADNKTALLGLNIAVQNAGSLNNLGCALMWLYDWSNADTMLIQAMDANTTPFRKGEEDAQALAIENYRVCQQAKVDYAAWQFALKMSGGEP